QPDLVAVHRDLRVTARHERVLDGDLALLAASERRHPGAKVDLLEVEPQSETGHVSLLRALPARRTLTSSLPIYSLSSMRRSIRARDRRIILHVIVQAVG